MDTNLQKTARNIRYNILAAGKASGASGGHFGGSLSMADIMAVLFGKIMNLDSENLENPQRDRFILSKGHCAQALYATLCEFGFITDEQLLSFNANGGDFPSHCIKNLQHGIELSSGSLGLGLSFAIGQALALNGRVKHFVMTGNGELNEGSFWEAAMFAGHKKIASLCLIVDDNQMQNDGCSSRVMPICNWSEKLQTFNWQTIEVDGHDFVQIENALKTAHPDKPLAVIAHTVKGKGISFMENNPAWHHNHISQEQFELAIRELQGEK